MDARECLRSLLREHAPLVIALSGGTDSMTLLAVAADAGIEVAAVTVDNGLCPSGEPERAASAARARSVPHAMLSFDAFAIPSVAANAPDRCYACKRLMMELVTAWAEEHGFSTVADGTNADDDPGDRPGMRALGELGVLSPFAECGIGKKEIARLAREACVPVLPSSSCLATRIPAGSPVTPEKVERVRRAEGLLRPRVRGRLRVRIVADEAVIEADADAHEAIVPCFAALRSLGFTGIRMVSPEKKERV